MLAQIVQMVADGAALPRADPAARRPGRRLVRAARDRRRGCWRSSPGRPSAGAALRLRPRRRRRRADHRLPVRARPRHADVDHGRRRPRRAGGRADQERRGAGAHGSGRHAGRRQDRHADRRQAQVVAIKTPTGFDETEMLRLAASVERSSEHPLGRAIVERPPSASIELAPVRGLRFAQPARA